MLVVEGQEDHHLSGQSFPYAGNDQCSSVYQVTPSSSVLPLSIRLQQERNFSQHHGPKTAIIALRGTLRLPAPVVIIGNGFSQLKITTIARPASPLVMAAIFIGVVTDNLVDCYVQGGTNLN